MPRQRRKTGPWRPGPTWAPEDQQRFAQHLNQLKGSGGSPNELDDFLNEERIYSALLDQAAALVGARDPQRAEAALVLLEPLLGPQTRGTNYSDALVIEGECLRVMGQHQRALASFAKALSLSHERGDEYRHRGARMAEAALDAGGALMAEALALLKQDLYVGTQKSEADFEYFFALALLQDRAGRRDAAKGSARSALDASTAICRSKREALKRARAKDFARVEALAGA